MLKIVTCDYFFGLPFVINLKICKYVVIVVIKSCGYVCKCIV